MKYPIYLNRHVFVMTGTKHYFLEAAKEEGMSKRTMTRHKVIVAITVIQTNVNGNRGTISQSAVKSVVGGGSNYSYATENSPLNLMQFQITDT